MMMVSAALFHHWNKTVSTAEWKEGILVVIIPWTRRPYTKISLVATLDSSCKAPKWRMTLGPEKTSTWPSSKCIKSSPTRKIGADGPTLSTITSRHKPRISSIMYKVWEKIFLFNHLCLSPFTRHLPWLNTANTNNFKRSRIYESHTFELRIKTWMKVILALMCTT